MILVRESIEKLEVLSRRHISEVPPYGSVQIILERPFCEAPFNDAVRKADEVLYRELLAPELRRSVVLGVLAVSEADISLEESLYTTFNDDEAMKERVGGIDSVLALAITLHGCSLWYSIVNYHLYVGDGENSTPYKYRGQKRLGPSAYLTRRPVRSVESKYAPLFPVHDHHGWYTIDDPLVPYPEDIVGVDLASL